MTTYEAFQAIAKAAGLPSLTSSSRDVAELRIENGLVSIYLFALDDDQIELSMRLAHPKASDRNLGQLLAENGRRVFGRLAVEPGTDTVVFCHRLWPEVQSEAQLLTEFDRFYHEAARLEAGDSAPASEGDARHLPPSAEEMASMIRI